MLCGAVEARYSQERRSGAERAALEDYKDPSEKLTYGPGEKRKPEPNARRLRGDTSREVAYGLDDERKPQPMAQRRRRRPR